MGDLKSIKGKLRTFHHATLMPINLLKGSKSVYCMPESINYISSIIKDAYTIEDMPSLSPSGYSDNIKSYYFKNDYDECFIILHIKENYQLVAGPVLNEKIHEGIINNIIRLNKTA